MIAPCPTEAVEYLRIEWAKYEQMSRYRGMHINTDGLGPYGGGTHNGRGRGTGQRVSNAIKSHGEDIKRPHKDKKRQPTRCIPATIRQRAQDKKGTMPRYPEQGQHPYQI